MTPEEIQRQQATLRQELGKRYAELPGQVEATRKSVYGGETMLPALRQTRDQAISQLWETDKMLADRYAKPESEMFIRDPYAREKAVAGRHQSIFEQVAGLTRAEESRRDILEDALERGVKIFQLGLEAREKEYDMLSTEFDQAIKIAQMAESKSEKAGKAKISQQILDLIMPSQPTEAKPTTVPSRSDVKWTSPQGQWTWDAQTQNWVNVGETEDWKKWLMSNIIQETPEAAESLIPLVGKIFPTEEAGALNERQAEQWPVLIDEITKIVASGRTPNANELKRKYPDLSYDDIDTAIEQAGTAPSGETGQSWLGKLFGGGGKTPVSTLESPTPAPTPTQQTQVPSPEEIGAAQNAIEQSTDRQVTYNAILKDFPYLIGYIQP